MRLGMRKMLLLGAGLAVAGSGYAFLAGNTMAVAGAGTGTGTVSGYTISNVHTAPQSTDLSPEDYYSAIYNANTGYVVTFDAIASSGEPLATEASISFTGYVGSSSKTSSTFACSPTGANNLTTTFSCNIDASAGLMSGLTIADITSYTVTATS
jgi:hypothetical protein